MDCVNHSGVSATAYCQNCGKALCPACARSGTGGQIFCEPCWTAWHSVQTPFVGMPPGAPSPGLAAVLGLIPGVGAMYNGQFVKGLVHVVIFAVLVSASHVYGLFGLFVAGWICYQVFDAYHTARARRDGEPLPDPLGLNEIGNMFGAGGRPQNGPPPAPGPGPGPINATGQTGGYQAPYQTPYQAPYQAPYQPPQPAHPPGEWQTPYQGPYQGPQSGMPGNPGVPPVPPIPPVPPLYWRRREPIGAVILIALGALFLLDRFDFFSGRVFEFTWPLVLIGLGIWLIVRRLGDSQGGTK